MKLSSHPEARRRRQHRIPRTLATVATLGVGATLLLTAGNDAPEGTCDVPITATLAREGISGIANDLDVDAADVRAVDAHGVELSAENRNLVKDLGSTFSEDVMVPVVKAGDHAIARVGQAACADLNGDFTPSGK